MNKVIEFVYPQNPWWSIVMDALPEICSVCMGTGWPYENVNGELKQVKCFCCGGVGRRKTLDDIDWRTWRGPQGVSVHWPGGKLKTFPLKSEAEWVEAKRALSVFQIQKNK